MNEKFYTLQKKLPFMIMSHRGFWGGNIVENTKEASIVALKAGADIIEMDVHVSADGEYYLFHSDNEKRLLGTETPLNKQHSSELDQLSLLNSIGESSGFYLDKLEDYLEWLPENVFVNIDRSWFYWEDEAFFNLLRDSGKTDQLFVKSTANKKYLDLFEAQRGEISYVVMAKHPEEVETVIKDYPAIQFIGVELLPETAEDAILDTDWLNTMREANILLIANTIDLGIQKDLFLATDDNRALLESEEQSWGRLLEFQPDIIQTDWPNFLSDYRDQIRS